MTEKRIGFVGLGAMGRPMVTRLLAAGYEVVVSDIDEQAVQEAAKLGAIPASDARGVASQSEIVLCSLPTPAVVDAVALGDRGLAQGTTLKVYVDLSTTGSVVGKRVAAALGAKDITAVDAPVSGGVTGAAAGTLAIMASGEHSAFERVKPVLEVLGKNIFYLGAEVGLGQTAKLANNLLSATTLAATAEVLAFAMRAGLTPQRLLEVVNAGSGRSFASEVILPLALRDGAFNVGFRADLMHKDVKLCMSEAEALGVPLWVGSTIAQFFSYAMTQGLSGKDVSLIAKIFSGWAGVSYDTVRREDQVN